MFEKLNRETCETSNNKYYAKSFSVTPLGPRSGLISWIEGSTPLFSLYKKWQQYEIEFLNNKQSVTLRPNIIFYNKLNPILKEKGIKNFNINQRNKYPINIMRQVLDELINDTPNNLISKELWCMAETPTVWWNSIQKLFHVLLQLCL